MTAPDLLRLLLRRWYLMLLGAVVTVAATYLMTHQPGVYWTKLNVVVQAPRGDDYSNNFADPHYALAPMAGVLVTDWNGGDRPPLMSSGDTTLFGEGRRHGIEVRVPNEGNQWQPLYYAPNVDVQVVSNDPETVTHEAHRVSTELSAQLERRQAALRIQPAMRMTTIVSPADWRVTYISGSRSRAALATGLVGAASTVIVIYWIERLLAWRRSRRTPAGDTSHSSIALHRGELVVDEPSQRTNGLEDIAAELAVIDHDVEVVLDGGHQLNDGK
jgi:hypothetical protein